jgi:hypothetical protein
LPDLKKVLTLKDFGMKQKKPLYFTNLKLTTGISPKPPEKLILLQQPLQKK